MASIFSGYDGTDKELLDAAINRCQEYLGRTTARKQNVDWSSLQRHRHHGLDIYMTCQHPVQLAPDMAALVGRHRHHVISYLSFHYFCEFPQYKSQPIMSNPENVGGTKVRCKIPWKEAAGSYRSATLHVEHKRAFPRVLIACGVASVLMIYFFFNHSLPFMNKKLFPNAVASELPEQQSGEMVLAATNNDQPHYLYPLLCNLRLLLLRITV